MDILNPTKWMEGNKIKYHRATLTKNVYFCPHDNKSCTITIKE